MPRYTFIITGDTDEIILDVNGRWPQPISDIEKILNKTVPYILDNVLVHVTEGDAHSFGSEIGGLSAECQRILERLQPLIAFQNRVDSDDFDLVLRKINEIDSMASIWED